MLIAALFIVARTCCCNNLECCYYMKQPKCSSIEKWIKKVWYIYTMGYSLVIERNEIGPFVEMWVDLETVSQSEESHKKVDIIINSYMSNLETWYQFSSVAQLCLMLCNPMDCSTPGLPVHHQLLEFTQTHVH